MSVLFALAQHNRLEMIIFVVGRANGNFLPSSGCCRADEVKHMSFRYTHTHTKKKKEKLCVTHVFFTVPDCTFLFQRWTGRAFIPNLAKAIIHPLLREGVEEGERGLLRMNKSEDTPFSQQPTLQRSAH